MSFAGSDETSDGSDTSTLVTSNTKAPVFEETLFQPQLFYCFLKYLAAQRAQENLVFMKHAYLFSLLNRPPKEMYYFAMRIVWMFLCESSPNAVNVCSETFKRLAPVVWSKDGASLISQDMFVDAYNEVKLMLTPLYNSWVATNEWTHIPFFHAPPPPFPAILVLPKLRSRFDSFLKNRAEEKNPTAETDCRVFKFLCELNDILVESKQPGAVKKECERKARRYIRANKAELFSLPDMDEVELPQSLLRHHKKKDKGASAAAAGGGEEEPTPSVDDDEVDEKGGISCLDYVTEAVDVLVQDLSESECYEAFSETRSWDQVEVMKVTLQQSKDSEGYVEYPTLAGALLSPTLGPLLMNQFKDTEKFQEMRYLLETHDYYSRFRNTLERKHNSQERKEMHTEAKRLFDKFIQFNSISIPQKMKNELTVAVLSFAGFKITPTIFQRSGAWIYNRIEKSWFREMLTLLLWVDHDFDNHSPNAEEMAELFDIKNVGDYSLGLTPHPDDVIGNRELWECFKKVVPSNEFNNRCMEFIRDYKSLEHASHETVTAEVESLVAQLKVISKDLPEVGVIEGELEQNAADPRNFNISVFAMPCHMIMKVLLEQYYHTWIKRCKLLYRKISWTPVKILTFIGSDAIGDTSCIPSVGIAATISSKAPAKERRRWGFGSFGKPRSSSSTGTGGISPSSSMASMTTGSPVQKKGTMSPLIGMSSPPSTDSLLSKPLDASYDDDAMMGSHHHRTQSQTTVPNTVPKSVPEFTMEVPTFSETFASTHLRRLFYGCFLEMRLGDDEKALWSTLCQFHADFACLTDAEVTARQDDIIKAALKVLSSYPQLPGHDDLVAALSEKRYTVSSHFFFDAESKLYGQFHASYQSFLSNNKWVVH